MDVDASRWHIQFRQHIRIYALRVYKTTLRKNGVGAWTGFDSIKQHFDDCRSETDVLNKPEKSRNMIAAPKGYDSKGKDLGEHTLISS